MSICFQGIVGASGGAWRANPCQHQKPRQFTTAVTTTTATAVPTGSALTASPTDRASGTVGFV